MFLLHTNIQPLPVLTLYFTGDGTADIKHCQSRNYLPTECSNIYSSSSKPMRVTVE